MPINTVISLYLYAGDCNARHTHYGWRLVTPKARVLFDTISKINLNMVSNGKPTYWQTDLRNIPDVIVFNVAKNTPNEWIIIEASFKLSSDSSPSIILMINPRKSLTMLFHLSISWTNWFKYRKHVTAHCLEIQT